MVPSSISDPDPHNMPSSRAAVNINPPLLEVLAAVDPTELEATAPAEGGLLELIK